jgi:hypothetical protein
MKLLDVAATLDDMPEMKLAKGQVGTIVQELADDMVLVEFADLDGIAYAIEPISRHKLMGLHYRPPMAA